MHLRGRRLKFTAVTAMVVLALTGFSTGRGHGHGHRTGHGSGGGGCSSSSQDHDSSSSTSGGGSSSYDDSDGGGSSTGGYNYSRPTHRSTPSSSGTGSSKGLEDATAKLVSCATVKTPYTTVQVSNPNNRKGTFNVRVALRDKDDYQLDYEYAEVTVPANGNATVRVKAVRTVIEVSDHCDVDPLAPPVN